MGVIGPEEQKKLRQQAGKAAYAGAEPGPWRKWRGQLDVLGISSQDACRLLPRESLRWYARFCFENGLTADGIAAYELLLDGNTQADWLFEREVKQFLDAVRALAGPTGILRAAERFQGIARDHFPEVQRAAAEAEAELGRPGKAADRMRSVCSSDHEDGRNHLVLARNAFSAGAFDESRRHLIAAAKRGVLDHHGIDLPGVGLSPSELDALASRFRVPTIEQSVATFVADPGLTLLPSKKRSPHTYAGDEFETPSCPGCNHSISLIATIDTTSEPSLSKFAEAIPTLPILHCRWCALMFHSPDYVIVEGGGRIELWGVQPGFRPSDVFPPRGPLTRQYARLAEPRRLKNPSPVKAFNHFEKQRALGPQIGGSPPWINEPRRRFCPRCDEEQRFYAAVCETGAFDTPVSLNPDGYVYFFACIACRIISTSIDNT